MNENERSDLERLIAAARPAGPSAELDARVREALSSPSLPQAKRGEQRVDRRLWFSVAASALIAAGLGFLGGRITARPAAEDRVALEVQPSDIALESPQAPALPPSVTRASLQDERLASLFLQPRSREGLLGAGPIRVEISQLP